ncbi:MAG: hypothetical protein WC375_02180 [Methanomassiliicoccales archaeon]|jgi:hypothetical protein
MKIFRAADAKVAPSWVFEKGATDEFEQKHFVSPDEVTRISIASADQVTEGIIARECDYIEKCANEHKPYHYNASWKAEAVSHLREYATACGLPVDQFKGIDPEKYIPKVTSKTSDDFTKVASVDQTTASKAVFELRDVFHLGLMDSKDKKEPDAWQTVKDTSKLDDKPSILGSSVRAIRGGEDYNTNSFSNTAPGQNSITDPSAISKLAESNKEDNGEMLRRQKAEREALKATEHTSWQKSAVDAMPQIDIIPKGKVFPTEVMNAQPGLNTPSSKMGVYAKFDPQAIPEKTGGEQLSQKNEERRASIQREVTEDDWQHVRRSSIREVSPTFTDALKSRLEVIAKKQSTK